jgi:hypothetical protein
MPLSDCLSAPGCCFRHFSPAKAAAAAALTFSLIIQPAPQRSALDALFLAEVTHLTDWGRPVVGDTWIRMPQGVRSARTALLAWPTSPNLDLLSASDRSALEKAARQINMAGPGNSAATVESMAGLSLTDLASGAPIPWARLLYNLPASDRAVAAADMADTLAVLAFGVGWGEPAIPPATRDLYAEPHVPSPPGA